MGHENSINARLVSYRLLLFYGELNKEGVGIRPNQQAVGRKDRSVVNTYQQNNSSLTLAQMLFMQLSGETIVREQCFTEAHACSTVFVYNN